MLDALRVQVCELNQDLLRHGLVTWTSGNVSGRDPQSGLIAIKPSGMPFEDLTPENMVVVDVEGKVIEGSLAPSSDVHAHTYIYRHRPDVMGVVHTHSNYATAFAAVGKPIPVYLTAMADEFGGPIPIGGYAKVGNDEIGREIIHSIGDSSAILMQNHGVFTIGRTPTAALKAAVMVEDVARTVWLALQLGQPTQVRHRIRSTAHIAAPHPPSGGGIVGIEWNHTLSATACPSSSTTRRRSSVSRS